MNAGSLIVDAGGYLYYNLINSICFAVLYGVSFCLTPGPEGNFSNWTFETGIFLLATMIAILLLMYVYISLRISYLLISLIVDLQKKKISDRGRNCFRHCSLSSFSSLIPQILSKPLCQILYGLEKHSWYHWAGVSLNSLRWLEMLLIFGCR